MSDELAQARTSKKEFLEKIEAIIPWKEFMEEIQPYYYKGERGNKPYELELMLRIFILQNLYDISDMGLMNEIIDSRAFLDFCGVDSSNQVPDGDTIGRFRNLLKENNLQEKLFVRVIAILKDRKLILKKGAIVDSTIIEAPSSTKNQKRERDPEARSTKKGNNWHFGYKAHIGVDRDTGIVHHLKVTGANEHDSNVVADLMYGEEETLHGNSGYLGSDKKRKCNYQKQRRQEDKIHNQQKIFIYQKIIQERAVSSKENRESKIVRSLQGRTRFCSRQKVVQISKDPIPRSGAADR